MKISMALAQGHKKNVTCQMYNLAQGWLKKVCAPVISIDGQQVSGDVYNLCAHVTSMRQMSTRFGTRRMSWNRRKLTESKRMFRPGWCSQGVPLGISAPDLWLLSRDFRWRVRAARATSFQSRIEVLINPKDPKRTLQWKGFFSSTLYKKGCF